MEARSQLRHRPISAPDRRVTVGANHFILLRLLTVVNRAASTDFENIGKMSILNEVHFTMTLNLTRTPLLASLLIGQRVSRHRSRPPQCPMPR